MTRVRLLLGGAALLTLISLGVTWSIGAADAGYITPGTTILTNRANFGTGELDLVTQYTPGFSVAGSPGLASTGYADDVRVGLVPAAAVLILAASRPSRRTRRATTVAAAALGVCALWGFGHHLIRGPLLAVGAASLVAIALRASTGSGASASSPPIPPSTGRAF